MIPLHGKTDSAKKAVDDLDPIKRFVDGVKNNSVRTQKPSVRLCGACTPLNVPKLQAARLNNRFDWRTEVSVEFREILCREAG